MHTTLHERRPTKDTPNKIQIVAKKLQQTLLIPVEKLSLSDTEKSVLSTITLGYRENMSREVRRQFSMTGVAHILAVSGFHVAIVCGFLSFLLSFLSVNNIGRWICYILTILLLWLFAALSGLAASAVRSAIMLTLYLTGRQLRRKTDGYNTLAASAFCMLVYDPFYLFDIGFQLSYLAVYSILYLQPKLKKVIDVRNPVLAKPWDWITVTIAAQTGVSFLCLYYFGQFSLVFLLTNLPLTFIATLLIPLTLLWLILPAWFPWMEWLQQGIEILTRSMMWIVDSFSSMSGSTISFRFTFEVLILSYLFLVLLLLYHNKYHNRPLLDKKIVHLEP